MGLSRTMRGSPSASMPAPTRHAAPTASATPSSYAPGPNDFPHPPYPNEARDRRESGTVVMNVQFDASGDVTRADVAHSSGVASDTRRFVRKRPMTFLRYEAARRLVSSCN